jgi:hypothetical protein
MISSHVRRHGTFRFLHLLVSFESSDILQRRVYQHPPPLINDTLSMTTEAEESIIPTVGSMARTASAQALMTS